MLTLGLMEGVLSATVMMLILVGAANENAPLHRIFGPMVTVTAGFTAYLIYDSGRATSAGDVVGLAFFAFVAFFAPVGVMRAAWKATKAMDPAPVRRPAERSVPTATIVAGPAPARAVPDRRVA